MRPRLAATTLFALAAAAASAAPATADPLCLAEPVPAVSVAPHPLRFGITPLLAGSAGGSQGQVVPEDPARTGAALAALQPPGRRLVMRINRVFESDGQAGIDRAVRLADGYARAGFDVESQVRYHPAPAQDGDLPAWVAYVRRATRALAANPAVIALTVTNEVNLPISANTSDGAFRDPLDAIVQGVVAARAELDRAGRPDVSLGLSYAYRYLPEQDVAFWRGIGARATPAFRRALAYVGVQLYPDLLIPPLLLPGQTAGSATLDALALVRRCYMPLAGLGAAVQLWITENGYATNLGHTEAGQLADLQSTVAEVHRLSGTLGVTDYRYFNLRDNRPGGTDLFDDVGLLRADGSAKPAFAAYRDLVARFGAAATARTCTATLRLPRRRPGERYRTARAQVDGAAAPVALRHRRGARPVVRLTLAPGRHRVLVTLRTSRGRTVRVARRAVGCA